MIIKRDKSSIESYFEDNSGMRGAYAEYAAIAESVEDIKNFIVKAAAEGTPVTVCGALTGNTGAGLPYGGAVLSLEIFSNFGRIVDMLSTEITFKNVRFKGMPLGGVMKVGAAARICDIKDRAMAEKWLYAPDPTEQQATIGGNISTNASGARGYKFGSTRRYVNAINIIFTDGSEARIERGKYFADDSGTIVFDTDKGKKTIVLPKYQLPAIKNSAGYFNYSNADLIDVFIGSEGTLGIITEAEVLLIKHFYGSCAAIIFFYDENDLFAFVRDVKKNITPMSIEFFDKNTIDLVRDICPPLPANTQGAVMIEQEFYDQAEADEIGNSWIKLIERNKGDSEHAWFGTEYEEIEKIRMFRHSIPQRVNEIVHKNRIPKIGTDFAVPEWGLQEIIKLCREEFGKTNAANLIFGHIGENHLHANIIASNPDEYKQIVKIYEKIIKKVVEMGGTASAEHGIGKLRHAFLREMVGDEGFKEMAKFKKSLDKAGILGQDNVFPKIYLKN
ncbi:MAG: FAD-binding oxidoreductase [Elusimicrobiota bacterium]|nr:FAD-binding oxidoreductase [Elusimicrobiota bacterium]